MLRTVLATAAASTALIGTAAPAQAAIGPDAAACSPGSGRPAILVSVNGFSQRTGRLRVQIYDSAQTFLAKGAKLRRIDLPVLKSGAMNVCVAVPGPGRYAVAVRHDVDGDNAKGDWGDGGGFSWESPMSSGGWLSSVLEAGGLLVDAHGGVQDVGEVAFEHAQGLGFGAPGSHPALISARAGGWPRSWVTATRWMAAFSCRLPPRLRR